MLNEQVKVHFLQLSNRGKETGGVAGRKRHGEDARWAQWKISPFVPWDGLACPMYSGEEQLSVPLAKLLRKQLKSEMWIVVGKRGVALEHLQPTASGFSHG
ncbi:hypothetical protein [Reticulibacter mediterranei]|uniref:hypothetical protein n=1 Tax=Reticulibacter mediterranei TaxID=2778369 RepID=UPI001C68F506|nr:hypothetical protein [Reticulibacter mediterranei]